MSVNLNKYDWESIEINVNGNVTVGMTEISYNDESPVEARYGKGGIPRGFGRKNYKASGSGSLDRDEFDLLKNSLGGKVYNKPMNIVVSYAVEGMPTITDILKNCIITKVDTSVKQDDDNAGAVKIDFTILNPIEWGGTPAYE